MWRKLDQMMEDELLWETSSLKNVSPSLARKMRQTCLSRITYHRSKVLRRRSSLKLSQEIGILIWCNRVEIITSLGEERLLFLQAKASFEAIEAGLRFARLLSEDEKLQLDFYHDMVDLNSRPSSKRLRRYRNISRIGVGYRDKGTLPEPSSQGRVDANRGDWVYREDILQILKDLQLLLPPDISDEEWIGLSELIGLLRKYPIPLETLNKLLARL